MNNKISDPAKAFLGVGWSFPLNPDADHSDIALAIYEEDIREAIWLILETNHGERVMRPDFGADLRSFVFEPINTTTLALIQHRIEEALTFWEPRIDSLVIQITPEARRGKLVIDIRYRIRQTNTFYNLVYPFYLQEGRQ